MEFWVHFLRTPAKVWQSSHAHTHIHIHTLLVIYVAQLVMQCTCIHYCNALIPVLLDCPGIKVY